MADVDKWSIDKLNSDNWMTWKFQMKHLLLAKDLWKIVTGEEVQGDNATAEETAAFQKKAQKAFSTIVMSVHTSQIYLITSFDEPNAAWKALSDHFERDTLVNKLMLKKQYFRMEMKEGTSMEEHIKKMKELTDKLAALKAPISEEDQVVTLLGSLPPSYSTLVTALEAREAAAITLSYVQQSLINEEQKARGISIESGAGHAFSGRENKPMYNQRRCFNCGENGHLRRDCPRNPYRSEWKPRHKAKPTKDMQEDSGSDSEAAFTSPKGYDSNSWIIDSGASSHMTRTRKLLINYEEFNSPQKVCLGDGRTVDAYGRGDIMLVMIFKTSESKRVTMRGVLYIPKLACNLFSVRAASNKGNTVKFGKDRCWIRDRNGKLMGIGSLSDKLYYLNCQEGNYERASVSIPISKADLWHQRLGHLNEQQLKEMVGEDLVRGMDIPGSTRISFCEECVEEKMSRKPFKSVGEIRSTRRLHRVHSDVCGPMPTESIAGSRYFVTFIDDFTRHCKVYLMKNKSEVFEKFKEFQLCTTNECNEPIAILRSDNGGEYLSKDFELYLKRQGIHHELTAPYSPAQHGVAERANRTLMESARAMIARAGLPEKYWAEAVATAAYLRNRVPTRSLRRKTTPFEMWHGRKPDLSHLKVFGCTCYAYLPDPIRQGKLSSKAQKLRFIGYSHQAKGYRLIDDKTLKIIVRRDVVFNESDFKKDTTNKTQFSEEPLMNEKDIPDRHHYNNNHPFKPKHHLINHSYLNCYNNLNKLKNHINL